MRVYLSLLVLSVVAVCLIDSAVSTSEVVDKRGIDCDKLNPRERLAYRCKSSPKDDGPSAGRGKRKLTPAAQEEEITKRAIDCSKLTPRARQAYKSAGRCKSSPKKDGPSTGRGRRELSDAEQMNKKDHDLHMQRRLGLNDPPRWSDLAKWKKDKEAKHGKDKRQGSIALEQIIYNSLRNKMKNKNKKNDF